jgi:hypothetical protein
VKSPTTYPLLPFCCMMAPNAMNKDPISSPTRDETLLCPFQPKTNHHPPSLNVGKPPTTQTQPMAPPITSSVDNYPSDSSDVLKIFNQSPLLHTDRQGSYLTSISDLTSSVCCKHNEEWATGPQQKPAERDETDHIATIIKLKMKLAQAQAKNDQLALLLRQCMKEKMDLKCEMRASSSSSNEPKKSSPAHNRHHSFHAPPSYLPTNNMQRGHPTAHVHIIHESIVWNEETNSTIGRPKLITHTSFGMRRK